MPREGLDPKLWAEVEAASGYGGPGSTGRGRVGAVEQLGQVARKTREEDMEAVGREAGLGPGRSRVGRGLLIQAMWCGSVWTADGNAAFGAAMAQRPFGPAMATPPFGAAKDGRRARDFSRKYQKKSFGSSPMSKARGRTSGTCPLDRDCGRSEEASTLRRVDGLRAATRLYLTRRAEGRSPLAILVPSCKPLRSGRAPDVHRPGHDVPWRAGFVVLAVGGLDLESKGPIQGYCRDVRRIDGEPYGR